MPHADPKEAAEYQAAYRAAHREDAKRRTREWRAAHPMESEKLVNAWRAANTERVKATQKMWRENNKERRAATQAAWRKKNNYNQSRKRKAYNITQQLRLYGLTDASFAEMLAAQNGVCLICRSASPRMKNATRLYVDHCHTTGVNRGLLCFRCNSMLGCADESAERLRAAADYLERAANSGGAVRSA